MTRSTPRDAHDAQVDPGNTPTPQPDAANHDARRTVISMHENVPVWHDCCACEPEPYWLSIADEMGLDTSEHYGTGSAEETDCEG